MWWLDRWSLAVAFDAYLTWQRVLANVAVGLVAMLFLAALTRRLLASILMVSALHSLVFIASSIKLASLGLPVILQDMYFLRGLDTSSFHLLRQYLSLSQTTVLGMFAVVGTIAGMFWLEPRWCRPGNPVRFIALVAAIALLASLYMAAWPWTSRWYDKAHIRPSPLSSIQATLHGGLVASMIHYHAVQRHRQLEVDALALQDAMAIVARTDVPVGISEMAAAQRPDVVIVLSESFMDPLILKGFESVPDPVPAVRREIKAGNGGMMRAPAYGGGTVRTEFEVLTGMPVAAFPDASYPYVDLNPGFLPGVVSALEKHGYASLALHGNSGAFWNRSNTYEAMGIDRFITQRGMLKAGGHLDGGWLSDRSMTDILLGELRSATRPTVAIAISIENHGPYDGKNEIRAPAARASIRLPSGMDAAAGAELRNYLYHLGNADREFDRLLTGLRSRKRPFVLLFFGDHLPALVGGAYEQLGFVDGLGPEEQSVPWVLLTDVDGADRGHMPATARAWQLPALLMGMAGIDDDGWFDFVAKVGTRMEAEGGGPTGARLSDGLNAGAVARLQDRFDEHAHERH
jgi:phosphoglycerol transferase MdoB-like AlkP superfamily enzyme